MPHHLPVATEWFAARRVADGLTCLWEPHVHSLMQANVWHVRGAHTDLVVDAGLGVGDLRQALAGLGLFGERPTLLVLTHTHVDHMGGAHQFADRAVHAAEAASLLHPHPWHPLLPWEYPPEFRQYFLGGSRGVSRLASGEEAGPTARRRLSAGDRRPAAARLQSATLRDDRRGGLPHLRGGRRFDLGDHALESCICRATRPAVSRCGTRTAGALFTGDVIYDSGMLLDELKGSDVTDYLPRWSVCCVCRSRWSTRVTESRSGARCCGKGRAPTWICRS